MRLTAKQDTQYIPLNILEERTRFGIIELRIRGTADHIIDCINHFE